MNIFSRSTYRIIPSLRGFGSLTAIGLACALLLPNPLAAADTEHPRIEGYGGVFRVGGDPEVPSDGSKVVVDVTSGAVDEGVNKGLARAARFVNLFALGSARDTQVAVVLHGAATKASLSPAAYPQHFGEPNPNIEVIKQLREAGVQVLVWARP